MNSSAQKVVESFVAALERLDLDEALSLVAPDVRWINVPWKTAAGKDRFSKVLRGMFKGATRFQVHYRDIHERGDGVVYTDRVDVFDGAGISLDLPVKGEFRVEDGLIVEWVDRFSWAKLAGDVAKSLPRILRHRLGR
ncbi:MAG: limonene-1,2-epoxide hydrolase family protein [Polyangiales bacterium]